MAKAGDRLMLPVDAVAADKFDAEAASQVVDLDKVPAGWRVLDIGPKSIAQFGEVLKRAKLVVWNGPMGVFEFPSVRRGHVRHCQAVGDYRRDHRHRRRRQRQRGQESRRCQADDACFDRRRGIAGVLEGRVLPGVAALNDRR